jgi:hypothetical protein
VDRARPYLAARIQADRAALNRLADSAMNPTTRAAIACMVAELQRVAVRLRGIEGDEGDDLDRLDLVEKGLRSIEGTLQALGRDARWDGRAETPAPRLNAAHVFEGEARRNR